MSMFLTVYEADHIAMEGYQLEPITEGFLGDLWNRVVEIFKKIWDRIVKTAEKIKDWLTKRNKQSDEKIMNEVLNNPYEHTFEYDHKELIDKFDYAYNAFNDLVPIMIKLKECSKNPENFKPDSFKSQYMSTFKKWCEVTDNGETIAVSCIKDKIQPISKSNKKGTITLKEANSFADTLDACTKKYHNLKTSSQKILGGYINGIVDTDQFKNSIHFIRALAMTLANALMTFGMSMDHTLHCMLIELNACTKSTTQKSAYAK